MGTPSLMSSLSAPGMIPQQPVTPMPVQASPIPAPEEQTSPAGPDQPEATGILRGLYGRTLGKALRGLGVIDTSYTVDPQTGKTVATPVKSTPGETSKAILAAGLLGMRGIGPKEGQMTFAQGLLSGLSGGMDAQRQLQLEKDQKARLEAQQNFENELKARQASNQDKELQMRQTLDNAMVANYNADRMMKSYQLFLAQENNQHNAAQALVNRDKPLLDMYSEANVQPIATGQTAEDFQKLLQDEKSDISMHKVVPVITGYEPVSSKDASGNTMVTWQPVGAIYPVSTKFTPSMLGDLKAAGVSENDPLFKEVEQDVKNGSPVDPRKMIAVQKELGQRFDYAKASSEIAANNARIIQARASAAEAGIRARLADLQLQDAEGIRDGKTIFSGIGDPKGFELGEGKNKKHITIPTTPQGSYDFSQLTPKQKSDVRDYLNAVYGQAFEEYDKTYAAANKGQNPNPDKDPAVQQAAGQISTLTTMLNSLNGTKMLPGSQPQMFGGNPNGTALTKIYEQFASPLTPDQVAGFRGLLSQGLSETDALDRLNSVGAPPADKLAIAKAIQGFYDQASPLLKAEQDAAATANAGVAKIQNQVYQKQHPILTDIMSNLSMGPTIP